ncbi:hypothetical protein [Lentilactobacillus sp. Marseille-Q4993]|uniref:hypothetical protein n=1 Tax=Lentilactobacillus sp. Marseille-Q4993 TaxID=3039492 RepID=UPI0024BC78BB|nr:hypothetical protein [Lentilactobacillus sp. Marseille-Q4993]
MRKWSLKRISLTLILLSAFFQVIIAVDLIPILNTLFSVASVGMLLITLILVVHNNMKKAADKR